MSQTSAFFKKHSETPCFFGIVSGLSFRNAMQALLKLQTYLSHCCEHYGVYGFMTRQGLIHPIVPVTLRQPMDGSHAFSCAFIIQLSALFLSIAIGLLCG